MLSAYTSFPATHSPHPVTRRDFNSLHRKIFQTDQVPRYIYNWVGKSKDFPAQFFSFTEGENLP
ncbi:MAG: hypothetical protein KDD64_04695 [Bdellovibrionales bacterium]|nr:hypothetical protein [Bdellovibrionales bacterium]